MSHNGERSLSFRGHVVLGGELLCRTGLHIGGNRDSLVVGGHDLPVARDPATRLPLIPGSSLKGRMRALLEMLRGKVRFERAERDATDDEPDAIRMLFGQPSGARGFGPTRLVVRDALPVEGEKKSRETGTIDWWRMLETDGLGTEVKAETSVNRVTAAAHSRHVERVLAGSRFRLEFTLNVFDYLPDEERLLKDVLVSLSLLEDSYLGGHGSRGYGRVEIKLNDTPAIVSAKDYESGRRRVQPGGELKTVAEIDVDAWIANVREKLSAS